MHVSYVFTNDLCSIALCMSRMYSQIIYVALHYSWIVVFTNDLCSIALSMPNLYSQMIYVALHYTCLVCVHK